MSCIPALDWPAVTAVPPLFRLLSCLLQCQVHNIPYLGQVGTSPIFSG